MIPPSEWRWFGVAGHFICGHMCRFHLTTLIGDFLVSTVGEYWPDQASRRIHAKIYDAAWYKEHEAKLGDSFDHEYFKRFGYQEIGLDRKYETMVFRVTGEVCEAKGCNCGLPRIVPNELEFSAYNEAGAATAGHLALCELVAEGKVKASEEE